MIAGAVGVPGGRGLALTCTRPARMRTWNVVIFSVNGGGEHPSAGRYCQPCHGRGHEVIHGSPVLGRQCRKCGGSGKRQAPGGEVGKAALNMMDECIHVARQSMRLRLRNML